MDTYNFDGLEVSRHELTLQSREAASLPAFLGSTLRGAFGHALKQAVCVVSHRDCDRCMLAERCPYPYLFETPAPPGISQFRGQKNAPHPFILVPPFLNRTPRRVWQAQANHTGFKCAVETPVAERSVFQTGEQLKFGLTLIGRAIEQLPYVVFAVSEMARRGLGANRAEFALADVSSIDDRGGKRMVYSSEAGRFSPGEVEHKSLRELVQARMERLEEGDSLRLRFVTPTRIRVQDDLQAELNQDIF